MDSNLKRKRSWAFANAYQTLLGVQDDALMPYMYGMPKIKGYSGETTTIPQLRERWRDAPVDELLNNGSLQPEELTEMYLLQKR